MKNGGPGDPNIPINHHSRGWSKFHPGYGVAAIGWPAPALSRKILCDASIGAIVPTRLVVLCRHLSIPPLLGHA